MNCDRCEQPIDGQTFGPSVLDNWCMSCWWKHQDAEAARSELRERADELGIKVEGEPVEALRKELAALETRADEIEDEILDLEREKDEVEDEMRELEDLIAAEERKLAA